MIMYKKRNEIEEVKKIQKILETKILRYEI